MDRFLDKTKLSSWEKVVTALRQTHAIHITHQRITRESPSSCIPSIISVAFCASHESLTEKFISRICRFERIKKLTMLLIDQEVQPSPFVCPFICWLHHWLLLCTLGLGIVNKYWCRNRDRFLTICTFCVRHQLTKMEKSCKFWWIFFPIYKRWSAVW